MNSDNSDQQFRICVEFFIRCPFLALAPDHVWSLVDLWLDVDVSVACFCNGSDAPLHVLSVELELCFGDVVVELLDDLGVVCALHVGDVHIIHSLFIYLLRSHARTKVDTRVVCIIRIFSS